MQKFLGKLKSQINALQQEINLSDQQPFQERYFDQHLFNTSKIESNNQFYLDKIKLTYQAICDAALSQKFSQIEFLSEKLIDQISALTRELATGYLRQQRTNCIIQETLAEKHSRHLDYLRRLQDMKYEFELSSESINHIKVATLDNRIYRCEQAIKKIELEIENDSLD
ncbi:primosomal replication protein [Gilliamella sp. B2776]|uniref:primosomal replication protein PriC n=1 Tax=unclassified Gilliamella TaxID=2685620 RepID=UPI00226A7B99|nr:MULTISPECIES: primosomal replication protein PriC [unclassified Gilliamella]MCX8649493.1 primosomal replication protein [Gilliamella sp. B2779]MCX8654537.1 primosomal replication protein [Gilliamella sp. B2737]MCX8656409.1 primosomal replication protein [Gilliamella sp. B2894]MCX8664927.1 primosomal replication protein [Gilliamella sp. B2887]MCX8692212.1 primosomal replication protein [Gilliamella sp. B2776]